MASMTSEEDAAEQHESVPDSTDGCGRIGDSWCGWSGGVTEEGGAAVAADGGGPAAAVGEGGAGVGALNKASIWAIWAFKDSISA